MKRLTKRWESQPYPNLAGKVICEYKECDSTKSCENCIHGRYKDRLAAIEDILGDEYDLERLRELVEADREGKIPKYTIGDTVYDRFGCAWEVISVELHSIRTKNEWLYRCGHKGTDDYCTLWYFEAFPNKEAHYGRSSMNSNCYNTDCPFRQCGSSNPYYCTCYTCPRRDSRDCIIIATDHTTP